MANTFFGLTIGSTGLNAGNIGINTTAHNISNIKTKGYTRQQTVQEASYSIRVYQGYGTVGTGVSVTQIKQLRSSYYDTKYWNNNATQGEYSNLESYSLLMEDYLDEFNLSGFTTEYDNLFKAINNLTINPKDVVSRNQLLNYSQSIAEYFNTLSTNMSNIQLQACDEIKSSVNEINTIAEQIASLNKQINILEVNGGDANDLRDSRMLLVDELSKYINTTIREDEIGNGMTEFYVFINDQELVDGYDYNRLVCEQRETRRNASDLDNLVNIRWEGSAVDFNMYDNSLSGSIKGAIQIMDGCNECYEVVGLKDTNGEFLKTSDGKYIDVQKLTEAEYNNYIAAGYTEGLTTYIYAYKNPEYKGIPYYQSQLNEFARVIADEFNAIIGQGDMNGEPVEPFFVSQYGEKYITAKGIHVNQKILDDTSILPVSFDNSKGEANTDMAKALMELKEKKTINNGTFLEYLQSVVSVVSIDTSRARSFAKNYQDVVDTIDNQRKSISGVDEDEEAVDLVKYKEAYGLASKVISVMQEIYKKLIEQTGL